jgi:hypothetical protein
MPSEPWLSGSRARMERPALVRGLGEHLGAPELHHGAAVGLLVVRDLHHVDGALEAEHLAGQGDRGAPLPGAGLGGDAPGAGQLVVIGLRHRGVGLVRAGRRDPLVLEVDPGRRAQQLLQPVGADERGGAPEPVDLAHLVGDLDPALRRHLLLEQAGREERQHVGGGHRLERAGVEHRSGRLREVRDHVVPVGGDLVLAEQELGLHGSPCGTGNRRLGRAARGSSSRE